ncbi:MAG: hypothetical protein HXX08_11530 [Chloroflexi bacterium]|uniref:Large polyvalent protein associated domain-containing protein n=1 Tax=Candidatus Chlorohelix allophototropha TaxID=3003348 RepID=A0A8T7M2U4_9CHLR|nr:hypothetical protein [Chloroflexota bacterium]WJW65869.1 hypothetical protein OZ401_001648 [Chloroflexota bacterium L227-S17]
MTTRELSTAAQAAKLIRADMKSEYPDLKVRVTCHNFAGGDSITVEFYDQPPEVEEAIKKLLHKYEFGHFDGMTDMYEYSNWNDALPQTKYLHIDNNRSPEMDAKLEAFALSLYGEDSPQTKSYEIHTTMHRLFRDTYPYFWKAFKNGEIK